jgi:hypothetical protein
MSDLKPKGNKITLGGKEFGMLCTLNALDEIQDKFDISITELDGLLKDERKVFKVIKYLVTLFINEWIDDKENGMEHVTERWVGRKITPSNLKILQSGVQQSFIDSSPIADGDEDPNLASE